MPGSADARDSGARRAAYLIQQQALAEKVGKPAQDASPLVAYPTDYRGACGRHASCKLPTSRLTITRARQSLCLPPRRGPHVRQYKTRTATRPKATVPRRVPPRVTSRLALLAKVLPWWDAECTVYSGGLA